MTGEPPVVMPLGYRPIAVASRQELAEYSVRVSLPSVGNKFLEKAFVQTSDKD
jgi:hypothetical protein